MNTIRLFFLSGAVFFITLTSFFTQSQSDSDVVSKSHKGSIVHSTDETYPLQHLIPETAQVDNTTQRGQKEEVEFRFDGTLAESIDWYEEHVKQSNGSIAQLEVDGDEAVIDIVSMDGVTISVKLHQNTTKAIILGNVIAKKY